MTGLSEHSQPRYADSCPARDISMWEAVVWRISPSKVSDLHNMNENIWTANHECGLSVIKE